TAGGSTIKNAQPLAVDYAHGSIALAHNGNLVNARTIRAELEESGSIFYTTNDSEVMLHLLAHSGAKSLSERIGDVMKRVQGAYSLVAMTEDQLIAVRDPHGFRPLVLGRLGDAWVIGSETCALDLVAADYVRDVEPGEVIVIDTSGFQSSFPVEKQQHAHCIFEHIYFARPDSVVFGESVYEKRKHLGRQLAREFPIEADVVVPVPDSGVPAALGYSQESGIPYEMGMLRSHYVGRTFIEPKQSIRHFGVKLKLSAVPHVLQGRRVVVVDDSLVRGTTARKIISMVRQAGASEVHLRLSCPPIRYSCYYGIDTPTREELIAATHSLDDVRAFIGCDTLGYLSLEGMLASVAQPAAHCTACFRGDYLVPPVDTANRNHRPLRILDSGDS
ncbi:MAG: amidophosphoribosyltransferase, partial [Myxococcales bacterium]|nr:amidophosphoribosyltransferase [Myxococcales bacterium]